METAQPRENRMPMNEMPKTGPFDVLRIAYQAIRDLDSFVNVCWVGVGMQKLDSKLIIQLMHDVGSKPTQHRSIRQMMSFMLLPPQRHDNLKSFVEANYESGFPYLYCLVAFRLWSILETFIKDILREMLVVFPELQSNKKLQELKGELLPFLRLSRLEQAETILKLIEKDEHQKKGVDQFESLLSRFDLGGSVDPLVKKTLFELWAVRNVVAHKNGIVDSRFREICSWFNTSVGEQLAISEQDFGRYYFASLWYTAEVHRRLVATYPQYARPEHGPPDLTAYHKAVLDSLRYFSSPPSSP